jgi:hypothetical protein
LHYSSGVAKRSMCKRLLTDHEAVAYAMLSPLELRYDRVDNWRTRKRVCISQREAVARIGVAVREGRISDCRILVEWIIVRVAPTIVAHASTPFLKFLEPTN